MPRVSARSADRVWALFVRSDARKLQRAFDCLARPCAIRAGFLCVLSLAVLQQDLTATSFVLVRVANQLYIGSDGFRVNSGTGKVRPHCKITQIGNTVVLTWGLVQFGRVLPDGRVESHAFSDYWIPIASTPHETMFQKRDRLLVQARHLLRLQMEFLDHTELKLLDRKRIAQGVVGVAFISMKDGIPQIGAFELRVKNWKKRELETTNFPSASAWDWQVPHGFGNTQALRQVLSNSRECGFRRFVEFLGAACSDPAGLRLQFQTAPVPFVDRVLKLQTEFTPHEVGPPYAVAVLSDSGLVWLENGACEAPLEIQPADSFHTVGGGLS